MPKKKEAASGDKEPDFEHAIAELEEIVAAMEEEQLPLEELVERFEKGTKLIARCESVLASAKKRLQTIAARNEATDDTDPAPEPDDTADDDDIRLF